MTSPIALGPFDLLEPIGRGGQGEVWRGRHRAQDVSVAVKVLSAELADDPECLAAFRDEVRAVARLDHPNVIHVFDYGRVEPDVEVASAGRLAVGSPYLVMEMADGGRLGRLPIRTWQTLRTVLLTLLEGLAHAHARGVIHRDLKSANVLLGWTPGVDSSHDAIPPLKLTDFGVAFAFEGGERVAREPRTRGTPEFMAPERIEGRIRDQGPWTDLYSLGCVAYQLASGHLPFEAEQLEQLLRCHLMVPVPELKPRFPVPADFLEWLERLLAKHPRQRYRRAAHAAYDLLALKGERLEGCADALPTPDRDTGDILTTRLEIPTQRLSTPVDLVLRAAGDSPRAVPRGTRHALPRVPVSWRASTEPPRSMRLVGAGLGLYGLRPIPLVDRDDERTVLWHALRKVQAEGVARLVVLEGAAGTGKTRLAEWLAERVHELGVAYVLKAGHSPIAGEADGLSHMIQRHLNCVGLRRRVVAARAAHYAEEWGLLREDGPALAELMVPSGAQAEPSPGDELEADAEVPVRFATPTERYLVIRRVVGAMATERPVIIWIEDAQWALDALLFVDHLLSAQKVMPVPVLVVVTAQAEAVAESPREGRQLEALLRVENTSRIAVNPLKPADHDMLIRRLLGLESALAADVSARTQGNPLFAVQLVGHWVERGLLEIGDDGFRLAEGADLSIPDGMHELWSGRVEQLMPDEPAGVVALEVAAALGHDVNLGEWAAACRKVGVSIPSGLVDAMVERRLAYKSQRGWSFSHGMLRESLVRRATEAGRWSTHHRAAAAMLKARYRSQRPGIAERLGRHLLEAGAWADCLAPLLIAVRALRITSQYDRAHALLDRRATALEALGEPPSGQAAVQNQICRGHILGLQGQLDEAEQLLRQAERDATGHPGLQADARAVIGVICFWRGEWERSQTAYEASATYYRETGEPEGLGRCLRGLAEIAKSQARLERAEILYQEALALDPKAKNPAERAAILGGYADLLTRQGNTQGAESVAHEALGQYRSSGSRHGEAIILNSLGELARARDDLEAAERYYRDVLALLEAIGAYEVFIAELNLGLVQLAREDFDTARDTFERTIVALERVDSSEFRVVALVGLLVCSGHECDWVTYDDLAKKVSRGLERGHLVDDDLAMLLESAAQQAAAANQPTRARLVKKLARRQRAALGVGSTGRLKEATPET